MPHPHVCTSRADIDARCLWLWSVGLRLNGRPDLLDDIAALADITPIPGVRARALAVVAEFRPSTGKEASA